MPSPEYLEAGQFKLSKKLISDLGNDVSNYTAYYQNKLKELEPLNLNLSSIALVCNIKTEKAKICLHDLFACLIEMTRKETSNRKIAMTLRKFGVIEVQNGQLSFSQSDGGLTIEDPKMRTENRRRAREDEIGSMIDGASASLSQRGGLITIK